MGTPEFAAMILCDLIALGLEIALVVTQEDKPVGRKQILTAPSVKEAAIRHNLPVAQPHKLETIADEIAALKPDLIVVVAYGQILSKRVLAIAPCLNLHASLLPKYRGASPVQAALLNGDKTAGITIMHMEEGLDTGQMAGFCALPTADHTAQTLTNALAKEGAKLLYETLKRLENICPIAQHGADADYVRKIVKQHGLIDFERSAEAIERAYRAYTPQPTIYLASGLRLLELAAIEGETQAITAGAITAIDGNGVVVACKKGAVKISLVQPSGKNPMGAKDYLNGKRLGVGDYLS
ncbi:methionyl-tRNA formyltransferase [Campylobacterota bacterium]|nr:methionyl-tRNA formyltransferase [Campylobacterota bacterium]